MGARTRSLRQLRKLRCLHTTLGFLAAAHSDSLRVLCCPLQFKRPNYQKVNIDEPGRPLVFSFGQPINQSHLQDLRAATKAALGVYPYTVSMNGQDLPEIDAYALFTPRIRWLLSKTNTSLIALQYFQQ